MVQLWIVHAFLAFLSLSLCEKQYQGLDFNDPCLNGECKCFKWRSLDRSGSFQNQWTVNCTGSELDPFGLHDLKRIPNRLPINTTYLIVSGYHLGTLGISSIPASPVPLNPNLHFVVIQECGITYLSSEFILTNSDFRSIDLNSNFLKVVEEDTFAGLRHLENISIANNALEKIKSGAFRDLSKARTINLSINFLREVPVGFFDNKPQLEYLDLSNNWLANLPWDSISRLLSLKALVLNNNHWNCSCNMSSILNLNHSLLAGTNTTCVYPESKNATMLEQLTQQDFAHCFTNRNGHTRNIAAVITVLLGILVYYNVYSYYTRPILPTETIVGGIMFISNHLLGQSGNVFEGKIIKTNQGAAIKKCNIFQWNRNELDILLHLSEKCSPHPNVIRFLCYEDDSKCRYLALELCEGNLMSAVMDRYEEFCSDLKPEKCFLQLAHGINFLHKLGIQHRDIKPENILWKKENDVVRFIISDFDAGHFSIHQSLHKVMYGTLGWTAPELWGNNLGKRTTAVDIFSLGCVFYFVMTRGGHPFGSITDTENCQQCIMSQDFTLSDLYDCHTTPTAWTAEDLITKMILETPADRLKAGDIEEQPLLWTSTEKLNFFHKIGGFMEDKKDPNVVVFKEMLESMASTVFHGCWMDELDGAIKSDLSSFKSGKEELCVLLRVIRNKIQHFRTLSMKCRRIYLGSEEGVVEYYVGRFPKLLLYTYLTLTKSGLEYRNGVIYVKSSSQSSSN